MAANDRIKGITIEINGDTTKLTESLKGVTRELNTTQSSLKEVNKLLKLDPGNVTLLKQKQDDLTNSIKATEERIKAEKTALEQMKNAEGFDANSKAAKDLETQIAADEVQLKSLKKEMQDFGSVGKQQLNAVGDKFEEVGKKLSGVGDKMSKTVTVPIVGAGAAAVKITADFDTAMSQVAAISGATGEDFDALRNKAREMGSSTKFSATEAAEAMNYMAMAGWKTEDMLNGITGIMNLAAASGEDLGTTSDIVTDALTAFGMSAEESGQFADVLAATAANANTNVSMLGETFKYAAPVAGALGYSVEDVAIAAGLMGNAGIKASMAGTTLRNIFTRMAKPTDEVQTAMDRLGVSLADDEGNMYSFQQIMDQLRASFGQINMPVEEYNAQLELLDSQLEEGTLTQSQYDKSLEELTQQAFGAEGAEKARAAAMLAGQRGMSGLLAIVNASTEDYQQLTDAIYGSSGAAEEMADIMMDNVGGEMTKLKSQLQELAISFGDTLVPVIRDFIQLLQGIVDDLNSMDEEQRKNIITIAAVVASVGPLLSAIGRVSTGIGALIKVIPLVGGAFEAVGAVVTGGLIPAIGSLIAAAAPILAAAAPFIAVGAAIVAAGVLVYKNWDKIKEGAQVLYKAVSEKWAQMKQKTSETWENIKKSTSETWDNVKKKTSETWNTIKTNLSETWNKVKQNTSETWSNIKTKLSETWDDVKEKSSDTWSSIKETASEKWNDLKSTLSTTLESIMSTASDKLEALKNKFTNIFNNVKDVVRGAIETIKGIMNFEWHLPHLALPHFYIAGQFSLRPPSVPYIGVDWYKKAMRDGVLFTSPTVLQTPSGMKGFGDAGAEIVLGLDRLRELVGKSNTTINVYGAAGQSEEVLAQIIMQKLTLMEQRQAAGAL